MLKKKPPSKYTTDCRWLERSRGGDGARGHLLVCLGNRLVLSAIDVIHVDGCNIAIHAWKIKSAMLFTLILVGSIKLEQMRSWLQPHQGTLGGHHTSLSLFLLTFIPPSSLSFSSGLASGLCSVSF